ncbi:MAG: YeeE/YedE thiosulfate transporter family protein, partial [Steroidobacteraceae bacterium]
MDHTNAAWSPYLVGALIGVLSMLTFYFSDKPLGVSTSYARLAGLIGNLFSKAHTESLKFYQDKKPKVEWEVMLMLGIILGAFVAAYTGGEITAAWVPVLWQERFGTNFALRGGVAFAGGLIMAYGARLAGGCTSGHGISGALQLSVSSWIALAC